jgi:small GTP-binding protein
MTDLAWEALESLRPFFALSLTGAPEEVAAELEVVLSLRAMMWREERRITFFGAFKAGKSTLMNVIIGAPLLPVRAQRTTSAVTTVRYGDVPTVSVIRGGVEEDIRFDDAGSVIVRSLAEGGPAPVEEVRVSVPLPLLRNRLTLVDTPGLLDEEELTGKTRQEIERTDLAVMVLSADKILSTAEREAARRSHDLLHGNIVFVVNRLDTVDEEDRDEVLDWARDALGEMGNGLVGKPRIFATAVGRREPAATGDADLTSGIEGVHGSRQESDCTGGVGEDEDGLAAFERWLRDVFASDSGDRIAVLSRLGILEERLLAADDYLRARLDEARAVADRARDEEAADLARERARIRGEIAQGSVRLRLVRDGLPALGDAFVARCVEDTRLALKGSTPLLGPIAVRFEGARERYVQDFSEAVSDAVAGLPVMVPPFDLTSWIFRANVDPASHPAGDIGVTLGDLATRVVDGGSAGREAGANLGAWIGKNVFRVDLEKETLKRVEGVARASATSLKAEAEKNLGRVETLLSEADAFYERWTRAAPQVEAAEAPERLYRGLTVWSEAFLREVGLAVENHCSF